MGPVGIGLALGTVARVVFAKQSQESKARVDELAASLDQQTGAVTENTVAWVNKKLVDDGVMASAKKMGIAVADVTAAAMGNTDAMTRVNAGLDAYVEANGRVGNTRPGFDQAKADALNLSSALGINNKELTQGVEKTKLLAEANAGAIDPTTGLTGAQKAAAAATKALTGDLDAGKKAAEDLKKAHDDLKVAIQGFGSVTLDARGAARDYQAALDDATKALKDNGRTLDTNTEKGRANQVALEAIRTTALQSITANFEHTGSVKALSTEVDAARGQFVTMATKMGMSKSAANALATELGLTKDNVVQLADAAKKNPVKVTVTGIAAGLSAIDNLKARLDSLKSRSITVTVNQRDRMAGLGKADGGLVTGVGGPREDNIPIMGSVGEFMVNARSYSKHSSLVRAINADTFASGGEIGRYVSVPRYVSAPAWSGSHTATSTSIGGATTWNITEVSDPVGTAQAIARRWAMAGAI